jgi:hypothetical protein
MESWIVLRQARLAGTPSCHHLRADSREGTHFGNSITLVVRGQNVTLDTFQRLLEKFSHGVPSKRSQHMKTMIVMSVVPRNLQLPSYYAQVRHVLEATEVDPGRYANILKL